MREGVTHLWVGRTLEGRYVVRGVLGSGGMGHVLLAEDQKTGRTVAVKVPRAELLDTADVRAKFVNEVKVLLRIQHANAVKVLDVGEEEGLPFVVMEHLTGGSLEEVLRASGGRQSPAEVLPWLERIADVLDWLHRDGNVHRDVKPANILFDSAGQARLSDFGIAKMVRELSTKLSSAMLTFDYAPPEAFLEQGIGPAYDQYSLAATVYRTLSGEPPHADVIKGAAAALMYARLEKQPKELTILAPNVPAAAAAAITRSLATRPSERFASCSEMAVAFRAGLLALAHGAEAAPPVGYSTPSVEAPPPTPATPVSTAARAAPPKPRSKAPMYVLLGFLVLMGAAWAVVAFVIPQKPHHGDGVPVGPVIKLTHDEAKAKIIETLAKQSDAVRRGDLSTASKLLQDARDLANKEGIEIPAEVNQAGNELEFEKVWHAKFDKALSRFCNGDYATANLVFVELELAKPTAPEPGQYIGRIYYNLGIGELQKEQPWEAVFYFENLLKRNPADAEAKDLLEFSEKFPVGSALGYPYTHRVDPLTDRTAGCR